MSGKRWCSNIMRAEPRGRVQISTAVRQAQQRRVEFTLPEGVLRLAQTEYEHQYGHTQDYERMQERGGLSILEVVGLLADYCERLGGKPTIPRKSEGEA